MKKFKFKIQGNPYDVEIKDVEDNVAHVEVNGTHYQVEIQQQIETTKTPTLVRKVVKAPKEAASISKSSGITAVKAPLPGNIIQIAKNKGDTVAKGDLVMVYEAMKMENKVLAEKEGTIAAVKVAVGDAVLQGDVLFEIQ